MTKAVRHDLRSLRKVVFAMNADLEHGFAPLGASGVSKRDCCSPLLFPVQQNLSARITAHKP